MNKLLLFSVVVLIFTGFKSVKPIKNKEGFLLFNFIYDNSLFFIEDTSFLTSKKDKKIYSIISVISAKDEDYPFFKDSLRNNASKLKDLVFYRDSSHEPRIAYYARVQISPEYLIRVKSKNKYMIRFNNKYTHYSIRFGTETKSIIYR